MLIAVTRAISHPHRVKAGLAVAQVLNRHALAGVSADHLHARPIFSAVPKRDRSVMMAVRKPTVFSSS